MFGWHCWTSYLQHYAAAIPRWHKGRRWHFSWLRVEQRSQGPATCWCFERSTVPGWQTIFDWSDQGAPFYLVFLIIWGWSLHDSHHGCCEAAESMGHAAVLRVGTAMWRLDLGVFFYGSEVTWGYSYGHQWEMMGKWWEIVIIYSIMAQLTLSFWACFMIYIQLVIGMMSFHLWLLVGP